MKIAALIILLGTMFTLFIRMGGETGTIAGLVVLGIFYLILRNFISHYRSKVEIYDEMLSCRTPSGRRVSFPWNSISHCGFNRFKNESLLYIYREDLDQILSIPDEFHNFSGIRSRLAELPSYEESSLPGRSAIIEMLKERLKSEPSSDVISTDKDEPDTRQ